MLNDWFADKLIMEYLYYEGYVKDHPSKESAEEFAKYKDKLDTLNISKTSFVSQVSFDFLSENQESHCKWKDT
jgi:hypothetical protein